MPSQAKASRIRLKIDPAMLRWAQDESRRDAMFQQAVTRATRFEKGGALRNAMGMAPSPAGIRDNKGFLFGTKPICVENKGALEEQTQTKPKNKANCPCN
jgi:hypothetical protein